MDMEKKLIEFIKNRGGDASLLADTEEVCLDSMEWKDGKITTEDWDTLASKCESLMAFSAVACNLTTVELPSKPLDTVEVLDISQNPGVADFAFIEKFPGLVSLTLGSEEAEEKLTKLEQLDIISKMENLKVLEFAPGQLFGHEDDEKFRAAVFAKFPAVMGVNGYDKEGNQFDDDLEEEDFDFGDEFSEFAELEEEDEEEEAEGGEAAAEGAAEGGEEEAEAASDEPEAKRQKTEEA